MNQLRYLILAFTIMVMIVPVSAQENYRDVKSDDHDLVYHGGEFYSVKTFPQKFRGKRPKNIILMIGDGMGVDHVFAAITANGGHLFLDNFKFTGFSKTQSADEYITDSAAGGTAIATGIRTRNGALAVDMENNPRITILEEAEERGLSTGLVSTSAITHATPASFIAHQYQRSAYEAIAADFLKTDIDVFIGGGYKHFTERQDGRNLADELKNKGYQVLRDMDEVALVKSGKLAGLTAPEHNGRVAERGNMLPAATKTAINILKNNKKGFFLMVEGSQIDWAGHQKNTTFVIEEMLDFDRTIGEVLEFASSNGQTLVIITADHETGGLSIIDGNFSTGMVKGSYNTTNHTAVMVPVFAFGPGADRFTGIMNNTDIYHNIKKLVLKE